MTRLSAAFVLALPFCVHTAVAQDSLRSAREALVRNDQELRYARLLLDLAPRYPATARTFRRVGIVDVVAGRVMKNMRVETRDGRIVSVSPDPGGLLVPGEIDGANRFLAPGMTDMHAHQFLSTNQHLLNIAAGVTTLRDMDGFGWTRAWQNAARADRLIVPNMIVVGRFMNARQVGFYAQVVRSADEGRAVVRQQADSGYDYVKVYSELPAETYLAIADEARKRGIGMVGHVPGGISLAQAATAGQQTAEHFFGIVDAGNYQVRTDDWQSVLRNGSIWLTPTMYVARRTYSRGAAADEWFSSVEARYVSAITLAAWRRTAAQPAPGHAQEQQRREATLMKQIATLTRKILVGTDAGGGMEFVSVGFGMLSELQYLTESGLSLTDAFRGATSLPAEAMGRLAEFGTIAPGLRADFILLDKNPMQDLETLRRPLGVMLRGRWLARAALDSILDSVASIAADTTLLVDPSFPDASWSQQLATRFAHIERDGYRIPDIYLREINRSFRTLGLSAAVINR